jgi:hypothetical protein
VLFLITQTNILLSFPLYSFLSFSLWTQTNISTQQLRISLNPKILHSLFSREFLKPSIPFQSSSMAETTQLTRHIESYVDSSSTPTHQVHSHPHSSIHTSISPIYCFSANNAYALQASSLDAIGLLIKTNALTLEALVCVSIFWPKKE